jgi:hypothetical protein
MKRGAMSKDPKTRNAPAKDTGKVYAGGSSTFNEATGRYSAPPRGSERLSPGVYRAPGGQLMTGQGRILPRPQPMARPNPQPASTGLAQAMQNAQPMTPPQVGQSAPAQRPFDIFSLMQMNRQQQQQQQQPQQQQQQPQQGGDMMQVKPWLDMQTILKQPQFNQPAWVSPDQRDSLYNAARQIANVQPQTPFEVPSNMQFSPEQLAQMMRRSGY